DAASLGVPAGGDDMARQLEAWLSAPTFESPSYPYDAALLVSDGLSGERAAIEEWNGRFAFPRIVVDRVDDLVKAVGRNPKFIPFSPSPAATNEIVSAALVTELAGARAKSVEDRAQAMIAALGAHLPHSPDTVASVATTLAFPVPGTIIFNPVPFNR